MHLYHRFMAICRLKFCHLLFIAFYMHSAILLSIKLPLLLAICILIKLLRIYSRLTWIWVKRISIK